MCGWKTFSTFEEVFKTYPKQQIQSTLCNCGVRVQAATTEGLCGVKQGWPSGRVLSEGREWSMGSRGHSVESARQGLGGKPLQGLQKCMTWWGPPAFCCRTGVTCLPHETREGQRIISAFVMLFSGAPAQRPGHQTGGVRGPRGQGDGCHFSCH